MILCLPLQDHLEQLVRDNEQLKAEVRELLNSSALNTSPRDQGKSYLFTLFLQCCFIAFICTFSCYTCLCILLLKFIAKEKDPS